MKILKRIGRNCKKKCKELERIIEKNWKEF
jgi:hypothetical protein